MTEPTDNIEKIDDFGLDWNFPPSPFETPNGTQIAVNNLTAKLRKSNLDKQRENIESYQETLKSMWHEVAESHQSLTSQESSLQKLKKTYEQLTQLVADEENPDAKISLEELLRDKVYEYHNTEKMIPLTRTTYQLKLTRFNDGLAQLQELRNTYVSEIEEAKQIVAGEAPETTLSFSEDNSEAQTSVDSTEIPSDDGSLLNSLKESLSLEGSSQGGEPSFVWANQSEQDSQALEASLSTSETMARFEQLSESINQKDLPAEDKVSQWAAGILAMASNNGESSEVSIEHLISALSLSNLADDSVNYDDFVNNLSQDLFTANVGDFIDFKETVLNENFDPDSIGKEIYDYYQKLSSDRKASGK
ncbi:MAG: hypothetical protein LBI43_08225 [Streptococcaceae bacterium]|jgi:hypothetical protein|nr:hypothetical protein [Streptococcaceae bacterium]